MIVDAFLTGMLPQNGQSHANSPNADGFAAIMDRTSETTTREQDSVSRVEKQERSDNTQRRNQQRPLNPQNPQGSQRRDNEARAVNDSGNISGLAGKTMHKENTDNAVATEKAAESLPEQVENEVKAKLAEVLDIPVEELDAILVALSIQLVDLLTQENLSEFMQAVHKAASPVELLNVPDIGQTFGDVKDILADVKDILEQIEGLLVQPDEVDMPVDARMKAEAPTEEAQLVTNEQAKVETNAATETSQIRPEVQAEAVRTEVVATAVAEPEAKEPRIVADAQVEEVTQEQTDLPASQTVAAAQQSGAGNLEGEMQNGETVKGYTAEGIATTSFKDAVQYAQSVARTTAQMRLTNPQEVIGQLLDRMRADVRGGISEVRITLHPESLGDVTLRVATQNGVVTAHFVAENQRVKEIIEANLERLKDALSEQGVEVSSLEVEVGLSRREQQLEEFLREQQRSSGRVKDIIDKIAAEEEIEADDMTDSSVDFKA